MHKFIVLAGLLIAATCSAAGSKKITGHNPIGKLPAMKAPSQSAGRPLSPNAVLVGYEGFSIIRSSPTTSKSSLNSYTPAAAEGADTPVLTKDTLIRNRLSGKTETITGLISVYSTSPRAISDYVSRRQLKISRSMDQGRITIIEAPAGSDMLALRAEIRGLAGVEAVQIDRLGEKHTAR